MVPDCGCSVGSTEAEKDVERLVVTKNTKSGKCDFLDEAGGTTIRYAHLPLHSPFC